ncbi:30S ribosomal protein S6, partial [Candidatus Microgenomates bacterium]|nr:30S ribosomal protein S6 [Candidatus Microgenomates bacterium]
QVKDLQTTLEKADAKVKKKKDPIKKTLAYAIMKQREAWYVFFELENAPEKAAEIDQKLHLAEKVLRYLYVSQVA